MVVYQTYKILTGIEKTYQDFIFERLAYHC
jgi:hypothetical protein